MLRFSLGVMRVDRIRNKYIRGTAQVGWFGDKAREARLRWFGHVQRSWLYWQKDVDDGTARQEGKRKAKEEVYGYGEGRHAGGWRYRGRCRGQKEMEMDDLLWQPLMGTAERRKRKSTCEVFCFQI